MDDVEATTREVVDGQLAAYNDGDADAFAAYFAEDAVIGPLSDEETLAAGREEIRSHYADLFEGHPDLECTFRDRLTVGPYDVCHERITGTDEPMEAVAVYEVREEAIERLWIGHE